METTEYKDRLEKIKMLRQTGINPYPDKFDRTHTAVEAVAFGEKDVREVEEIIKKPDAKVKLCGRLMAFRSHGKLSFGKIQDASGRIQICLMRDILGDEKCKFFEKKIDVADFIGVTGELFRTKHGEITLLVTDYILLSKTLRPLPEKFHGLQDQEAKYRQRYLDLAMNPETKKIFEFRSDFIRYLREFYWNNGFLEIECPVMATSASGALAKPFKTHHNALDADFFLRIAIETYQKVAIGGGFEKVFEIGKCFRNEGMDPSHLQEFTMNEFYCAYWNYQDLMKFTEEMFEFLLKKTLGTLEVDIKDREGNTQTVNFKRPWKTISIRDVILEDSGIDINKFKTEKELLKAIKDKKINIEDAAKLSRGNLIDHLYKKVSRPKMIGPVFLIEHPTDLSPLARRNDKNSDIVDRFQLVVNGWEIVNAYSELIDPLEQSKAFSEQSEAQKKGDEEAHGKDDEFVLAMEHGFPPIAGWGMGIDRIVALLTRQDNLKDVVLFPLMKQT
ncbi:lysine--tRNA ligase [Candidatus Peregrinibacteria bacterium]|nr:lysine--tRNA ligase [Candidatus Peregrinibacteria bacterium]